MRKNIKKKLVTIIMGLSVALSATLPTYARETISFPIRLAIGIYYDYLTIVTNDGNEWLLGSEPDSKYLDNNGNAIFQDGQAVCILFNTNGTINYLEDDVILDVVATNTSK